MSSLWLLAFVGLASADEPDPPTDDESVVLEAADPEERARQAESRRLGEELLGHATAGRMAALSRTYRSLMGLGTEVEPALHLAAADAAVAEGALALAVARLRRVSSGEEAERAAETLASLRERTGLVRISAEPGSVLACPPRFVPDEQAALQAAAAEVDATGRFHGLLPTGECTLDGLAFAVGPGARLGVVSER